MERDIARLRGMAFSAVRTAISLGFPPFIATIAFLGVEQPLLAAHNSESHNSGEESNDGNNPPAQTLVNDETDASSEGLPFPQS